MKFYLNSFYKDSSLEICLIVIGFDSLSKEDNRFNDERFEIYLQLSESVKECFSQSSPTTDKNDRLQPKTL